MGGWEEGRSAAGAGTRGMGSLGEVATEEVQKRSRSSASVHW